MHRMISTGLAIGLALIGLAAPGTAAAQDGWGWSVIVPSVTQTDTLGTHLRELEDERPSAAPRAPMRRMAPPQRLDPNAPPPNFAALKFTPSKQRRATNLAGFVERSRAQDPEGAKNLEAMFASGDLIEQINAAISQQGLQANNVADAYAAWWINAWQATRGHNEVTSRATNIAVRDQAARALLGTPEFAKATEETKQEFAESLLIQAAMIDGAVMQAKGNPDMLRKIGVAVNQGAQGMGLDLSTMELTDTGFVPAKAGSADKPAVPGEAPANASAAASTPADPEKKPARNGGLVVAGAVGAAAGVAGVMLLNRKRSQG